MCAALRDPAAVKDDDLVDLHGGAAGPDPGIPALEQRGPGEPQANGDGQVAAGHPGVSQEPQVSWSHRSPHRAR
jgi:hypothetical protein